MERELANSYYKTHTREEALAFMLTLSSAVEHNLRPDNEKGDLGMARVYAKTLLELVRDLQQDLTPRQQ